MKAMYRLLIVDDEAVIADGLYDVLSNFEIELALSIAYSGFDALEIMEKSRVDIVLTDIRMPGMDGIQLMEQILTNWPHCKIIFLTGYNDFDYVYQAIQRPGVSYILKTEGYRKVKEVIKAAVEQLDNELSKMNLLVHAQEKSNTLETLLQGEYMRHLLKGNRTADEMKIDFEKLKISLDPNKPILLVLGVLPAKKDSSYMNRQEAALTVKLLSDSFLKDKVKKLSVLDRYQDVMWLIQPSGNDEFATVFRYLEGIFELIEQGCTEALKLNLSFTLAKQPVAWGALPTAYEKLRHLQSVRVGDGTHMVQTVSLKEIEEPATSYSLTNQRAFIKHIDLLAIHLESGREEEFIEIFDSIVHSLDNQSEPSIVMECYYSIAIVLLSHINRLNLYDKFNIKSLMNLEDHPSWMEGFTYLLNTFKLLFTYRQTGEKNRAAQAVANVRNFIDQHLHEDLSLVRLAELIYFNPSYLSRMFKQECGYNLSEYIEERRIKKAKELLRTQEYKIAEVGAKVGYDAPHSFTRFFKKMTGLTPQEFRDGKD